MSEGPPQAGPAPVAESLPVPGTAAGSAGPPAAAVRQEAGPAQEKGGPGGPQPGRFYSPLVLNIARSEGVPMDELERIPGTGEGGRVTKKDLAAYIAERSVRPQARPASPERKAPPMPALQPSDDAALRAKYPGPGHEVLQMSNVLQRMAQHMVQSVQTSPHVAAIHEVDMTAVVQHRARYAEAFEKTEGFKLTYTPYVVDAVVKAIRKFPLLNSSVEGDRIIKKLYINLGIAVASDNGLIVPVIKRADEKNFLGYARAVHDLAARTRAKKLTPDDIQGGTFTISNYGVFGTLMGTPIINQPQVAILGTGAITRRVAVIQDAIAIRSMAYFTLSFDHRIIDGAMGGSFLAEIVHLLEGYGPETPL
jgi:2-oxoglutarate dehydrogenase E2 component (dihydrolipoamide succinyltransferase)